jgi:hypothetical protein
MEVKLGILVLNKLLGGFLSRERLRIIVMGETSGW